MKTVTFSNGHTATYKGRRDVKAAWMAILPDGEIVTGFSMDMEKAVKTSRSNAGSKCPHYDFWATRLPTKETIRRREAYARERGFTGYREWKFRTDDARRKWLAQCTYEYAEVE